MSLSIRVSVKIPRELFRDIHVKTAIAQKQRNVTAPEVLRDFWDTVEGWESHPSFSTKQFINDREIRIKIYPSGRGLSQYSLVNLGSPKHPIPAKRPGGFLRYQTGYISATVAGSLFSHRKQRFGAFRQNYYVNHPGFKAREFDKLIAKKNADKFAQDMQDAINEATKGG